MELIFFMFLAVLFIDVNCQYDFQQAVDQTQYLQQIEKYGASFTNYLYPNLANSSNPNHVVNSTSRGGFNNSTRAHYESFNSTQNSTERFLNKTISSMATGVCIKEVP